MVAVWMVKMAVDQIVGMVAMGHGFVPASGSMNMSGLVSATVVVRSASVGILCADFQSMLVDMTCMRMMQVAVMQKIDVPVVSDCRMTAVHAMPMMMMMMMMAMVWQIASAHA